MELYTTWPVKSLCGNTTAPCAGHWGESWLTVSEKQVWSYCIQCEHSTSIIIDGDSRAEKGGGKCVSMFPSTCTNSKTPYFLCMSTGMINVPGYWRACLYFVVIYVCFSGTVPVPLLLAKTLLNKEDNLSYCRSLLYLSPLNTLQPL